jgi:hypothetical protein
MHSKLLISIILALCTSALWAAEAARVVFTAGDATVAGRAARVGATVSEGELLVTGPSGYLYLETFDNGFFILRPGSTGQIVTYQIDAKTPANSRIKLELRNGVARHISGDAVKSARQNFRFNTPVAAVGVRGTDFTVFANQDTTRIAVISGGVVASPLSATCTASSFGPCSGPSSRELFANNLGQTLQVGRGLAPILLQGSEQSPDAIAPPRPDEPAGLKTSSRSPTPTLANTPVASAALNLDPVKTDAINKFASQAAGDAQAARAPSLIWGRWQPLLDQAVEVDVNARSASTQLIATNRYHALLRSQDEIWQKPTQASIGFSLQHAQAAVFNEATRQASAAAIENGQLQVDFVKSSFFTKFDFVTKTERYALQNTGEVTPEGRLSGGLQFLRPNNMDVTGALASDNRTAAYLFQTRLDDSRIASGLTVWGK